MRNFIPRNAPLHVLPQTKKIISWTFKISGTLGIFMSQRERERERIRARERERKRDREREQERELE
jgi:hypothetical protein